MEPMDMRAYAPKLVRVRYRRYDILHEKFGEWYEGSVTAVDGFVMNVSRNDGGKGLIIPADGDEVEILDQP